MMRRRTPNTRRLTKSVVGDEQGVALVEFALVLPLLIVLLFGILEFGRAINYWIDANHLANVAARWAAVDTNPGADDLTPKTLQEWVRAQADTDEMETATEVCIDVLGDPDVGEPVEAKVTVTFTWMPFIGDALGVGATDLTGTATMRLERPRTAYEETCA
jgi:Flp pilus assembly protein TadG